MFFGLSTMTFWALVVVVLVVVYLVWAYMSKKWPF